jgi:hypothetical protein
MEVPPWETLKRGIVPTYKFEETDKNGQGTKILIDGFEAKQSEFQSTDPLIQYILWYTVVGSFGRYFSVPRKMDVELKPIALTTAVSIPFGFRFPDESTDLSNGSDNYCKILGPETIDCGETEEGRQVTVNVVGAILGEARRQIVPPTYEMMGLWLCKDHIKVERSNRILEDLFGGQYFYRAMLIFANCQQFDLTANRNNILYDQEEYDLAVTELKTFLEKILGDPATIPYFEAKKAENQTEKEEKKREQEEQREQDNEQRLNEYRGRPDLDSPGVTGAPIKEPRSEGETALLLQAMISSGHPGIDFRIGEYKVYTGTDLLVEYKDKSIPAFAWVEIVVKLEKLFQWVHPPQRIHRIVCWELGDVAERQKFSSGEEAKLSKKQHGRYRLDVGTDSIEVYVPRELLARHN